MYVCEYPRCGAEYTSALAAAECAEQDAKEDLNTRQWFDNYRPGRRI